MVNFNNQHTSCAHALALTQPLIWLPKSTLSFLPNLTSLTGYPSLPGGTLLCTLYLPFSPPSYMACVIFVIASILSVQVSCLSVYFNFLLFYPLIYQELNSG